MNRADLKQFKKCLKEANDLLTKGGTVAVAEELIEDKAHWLWTRWKAMSDFFYFVSEIMGLKNATDGNTGRKRLDRRLHRKMSKELQDPTDALLLYPRGTMKSTMMKYYVIWRIILNPMIRIGFWSRNGRLVRKELRHIKSLCRKKILKELWPEVFDVEKFQVDNQDQLTIYRDPMFGEELQEAQVEVWGIEADATGHHYDLHLYDDIINESSVTNATQIEKVVEWWQMVQAIKEPHGIEKAIGTRYHIQDIYGHIIDEGFFEKIAIMPAIVNNKPTYSFYTMKHLDRLRKRMGEYAFSTQYMNNVVPRGRRIFLPPYPVWETDPVENRKYYITVDPAPTKKAYSDETAICVAFVDADQPKNLYFVECNGYKETPDKITKILVDKIQQYRPYRCGIELGLQQALQYLIDIEIKERERQLHEYIRPRFVEISTGNTAKADKFNRTIASFMRQGRAFFRSGMKRLFRQFDMYNPYSEDNNDDLIDGCSMMIQTVEHFAPAHWLNTQREEPNIYGMSMEQIFEHNKLQKNREKANWGWKFKSA